MPNEIALREWSGDAVTDYVGASAYTTRYLYAGNRIIEELDGDNNLQASYVYGQYVDEVLQMRRDTNAGTAGMEDHYYLHDDLYNVLALTDGGGNVLERYAYGDYGAPTTADPAGVPRPDSDHSAYGNPFLFNGRQYDETTGFYYYRTRYMDPELGRFISRDSIGLWGDENNLGNPYSYAGNNPWTNLDPFGEQGYAMGNPATMSPEEVRQYLEAQQQLVEGVYNAIRGAVVGAWNLGTTLYEQTQNPERHRREVQDGLSVIGDIFRADDSRGGASAGGMMLTRAEAGVENYIDRVQNDSAHVGGELLGDYLLGGAFVKSLKYLDELGDVGRYAGNVDIAPFTSSVTPEVYKLSLRRFETPSSTAAGRWEIANTGKYNYTVVGGGTKLDVDGIMGRTIQEAKFIGNRASSPYVPGSTVPDFLRTKIVAQIDDEFARMKRIISDPTNPLENVEIIINDVASERFFLDMLMKHGLDGRIVIR